MRIRFQGLRQHLTLLVLLILFGAMGLSLFHAGDTLTLAGLGLLGLFGIGAVWTLNARIEEMGRMSQAFNELVLARKKREDELQAQREVFKSLFQDNLSVMYIVNRATGQILDANVSAETFYGYSREQLLGMTIHQINSSHGDSHRTLLPESMYYRQNHYFYLHRLASGEVRDVELYASPAPKLGPRVYLSIAHDVTERTRMEEELRLAHEDISRLMRSITAILVAVDGEDRVMKWNDSASNLFGIASPEALGRPLKELGINLDWGRIDEGLAACRKNRQPVILDRVVYTPPESRKQTLKINIFPLPGDADGQPGLLLLGEDITQQEQLQSQLAQAQKLESIGQLAAGIAHEINTPAQYVSSNVTFIQGAAADIFKLCGEFRHLLEAAKAGPVSPELIQAVEKSMDEHGLEYLEEEVPKAIAETLEGVGRISTIVRSVKQFAHPGSSEMSLADLNEAMRSTVVVSRNEWKYVADLTSDLDPDLPPVYCMIGEINQVVLNLIINAAHAIADAARSDPGRKGLITLGTKRDGPWVEIRVEDNGMGIPPEVQPRIFDPFFTTKEVGKGSGQGLAIARSVVVEKHKGQLFFETEPGQGTSFHVRLPLQQEGDIQ